jgi:kynureninase
MYLFDPFKKRGGHVAIYHKDVQPISKALKAKDLIDDFCVYSDEGGIIRLSVHPFYTSREDTTKAAGIVEKVISEKLYLNSEYQQQHGIVT